MCCVLKDYSEAQNKHRKTSISADMRISGLVVVISDHPLIIKHKLCCYPLQHLGANLFLCSVYVHHYGEMALLGFVLSFFSITSFENIKIFLWKLHTKTATSGLPTHAHFLWIRCAVRGTVAGYITE